MAGSCSRWTTTATSGRSSIFWLRRRALRPSRSSSTRATSTRRDTFAIGRYAMAARSWKIVLESGWDLDCATDDAGRGVLISVNEDGSSRLELRDPQTLELREEVPLPRRGVVGEPKFSNDGSLLAFAFSAPTEPFDVYVYDLDAHELRRVTTSPREIDVTTLVDPELHRFDSFDGEPIPAFLFRPEGAGPSPPRVVLQDRHE